MTLGRPMKRRRRKAKGRGLTKKMNKQVKAQIRRGAEKNRDTTLAAVLLESDDVTITDLSDMAQGDGVGQRVGDEVQSAGLEFDYFIEASGVDACSRVSLIQWKQDSAAGLPTAILLFTNSSATSAPLGTFDYANRKQFRVLYDALIPNGTEGPSVHVRRVVIPASEMLSKVIFNVGATTGFNKIFLIAWSSELVAGSPPQMTFQANYTYYDM